MQVAAKGHITSATRLSRDQRRILVLGQAVHPTGYARVLHSIMAQLKDQFDIVHFGINYRGEELDYGWQIWPNRLVGDILGRKALPGLLSRFQPDLVFICHDPSLYKVHQSALQQYRPSTRVVVYCPVEWPFLVTDAATSLASVDRLVLYTDFGRREIQAAFDKAAAGGGAALVPPTAVIPHGVDTNCFRPLCGGLSNSSRQASRHLARSILFPDRPELADQFIVLNANRNSQRKRIDLTLKAFAQFAQGRADAWLYLHMGMIDGGVDALALARELGIANRLLLTTTAPDKPEVSDQQLNLIYNACDVGLNTASGEGWGLVAFEHAATGAAQIVPNHSACAELWRGVGLLAPLVPPDADAAGSSWSGGTIAVAGVADLLTQLYQDRQLLEQRQRLAFEYATAPQFNWHNIAARWASLFAAELAPPAATRYHT